MPFAYYASGRSNDAFRTGREPNSNQFIARMPGWLCCRDQTAGPLGATSHRQCSAHRGRNVIHDQAKAPEIDQGQPQRGRRRTQGASRIITSAPRPSRSRNLYLTDLPLGVIAQRGSGARNAPTPQVSTQVPASPLSTPSRAWNSNRAANSADWQCSNLVDSSPTCRDRPWLQRRLVLQCRTKAESTDDHADHSARS